MRPRNYLPTKEVVVDDDETCCHHSESGCPVVVVPQHMIPSSSSSTTARGRVDHGTFGSHPTTSRVWTHPSEQLPPPHRHDCGSKQHPTTNSSTDTITTTTTTASHPSIHARIPTNSSSSSSSRQGSHVLPPLVLDATASPSRTSRTSTHSSIPPSSRVMNLSSFY